MKHVLRHTEGPQVTATGGTLHTKPAAWFGWQCWTSHVWAHILWRDVGEEIHDFTRRHHRKCFTHCSLTAVPCPVLHQAHEVTSDRRRTVCFSGQTSFIINRIKSSASSDLLKYVTGCLRVVALLTTVLMREGPAAMFFLCRTLTHYTCTHTKTPTPPTPMPLWPTPSLACVQTGWVIPQDGACCFDNSCEVQCLLQPTQTGLSAVKCQPSTHSLVTQRRIRLPLHYTTH